MSSGHGTGVLRAHYAYWLLRGLTIGTIGTSSALIAQRVGVQQNHLVAARGIGLIIGPVALAKSIKRALWNGESQSGFVFAMALKIGSTMTVPRAQSGLLLYTAFLAMGFCMAFLDTQMTMLVSHVHGAKCGQAILVYTAVYGLGSMLAPHLAVMVDERAWDTLALADLAVTLTIAKNRLGKGKPRDWMFKIRSSVASKTASVHERDESTQDQLFPREVLNAGVAYIFVAQICETAVTCWAFTFANVHLGLPVHVAAWLPSCYYLAFTVARLALVPATSRLLPSTILHCGTLLYMLGGVAFCCLAYLTRSLQDQGVAIGQESPYIVLMLFTMLVLGTGACTFFAMLYAALSQHGKLDPQAQGVLATSYSVGCTMGMWLPGIISLPKIELLGSFCLALILNSHLHNFPLYQRTCTTSNSNEAERVQGA